MKMRKNIFEVFDYLLLSCVIILVLIGISFIYSSGINSDGVLVTTEYVKQIIWAILGLFLLIITALYDYRKFERYTRYIYFILLFILLYTSLFGRFVNGARSWIGIGGAGIQPSEFGKIIYILFFAKYLSDSKKENQLKRFIIAIIIFILPVILIMLQPDLGTASVYIPIFLIMCFMSEIPFHYIFFFLGIGAATVLFTILPVWNIAIAKKSVIAIGILTNTKLRIIVIIVTALIALISIIVRHYFHGNNYYYWISYLFFILTAGLVFSLFTSKVMKGYQIKRLIVYMNPSIDPLGSGWNIIQSKIAIGSGGVFGRTFLHGTQSHYRFLPQQSTDFIFSILSEELGFIGGLFVFLLFGLILFRTLSIMRNTSNHFGMYISSGIFGMFCFHFFVNVGMVMGIMPITGIPLLFLSYGGSSLWTAMLCIGLLMSIKYYRFDLSDDMEGY
jgi:rod shape determining protein RodA